MKRKTADYSNKKGHGNYMKWQKRMFTICLYVIMRLIGNNLVHAEKIILCDGFTCEEISMELKEVMNNNSFKIYSADGKKNDWVRFKDLRYLKVKHWGFDGKVHNGEIVVHNSISQEVLEIFKELLDAKFPIYQMKLIDNYNSDDEKSMCANNTSCLRMSDDSFNRKRPWHALGLAVDINPMNNPYSYPKKARKGESKFVPGNAAKYLNITLSEKGMIKKGDACYNAFVKRGWKWDGLWTDLVDLHHFQKYTWTTEFPRKYKK